MKNKFKLTPIELTVLCCIGALLVLSAVAYSLGIKGDPETSFMVKCVLEDHSETACRVMWKEYNRD